METLQTVHFLLLCSTPVLQPVLLNSLHCISAHKSASKPPQLNQCISNPSRGIELLQDYNFRRVRFKNTMHRSTKDQVPPARSTAKILAPQKYPRSNLFLIQLVWCCGLGELARVRAVPGNGIVFYKEEKTDFLIKVKP